MVCPSGHPLVDFAIPMIDLEIEFGVTDLVKECEVTKGGTRVELSAKSKKSLASFVETLWFEEVMPLGNDN